MSASILPFTAGSSSTTSAYLAVTGCVEAGYLSPRVMKWNDDILLIDLSPTLRYWRQQASEHQLSLEDFLISILPEPATAILAEHPWQAVLNLKTFSTRGHGRFLNLSSPLGRSLMRDLDWNTWQETCLEISTHFEAAGIKTKGKRDTVGSNLRILLQTASRMQLHAPAQLRDAETASVRRRFGTQLSLLWEWTWADASTTPNPRPLSDDFPWRLLKFQEPPQVHTLLNHPLREWDHIEPLLRDDFNRLCNLTCWTSSERVVSLEWVLSFSNSPPLTVPILFRHPHSLHREAGQHKTALVQAFHSWQSTLQKRLKDSRFKADTQYLDCDSVSEWTLSVKERLIVPLQLRSLFEDDLDHPSSRLRDLENTLPVSLEMFDLTTDWTPEGSWKQHESKDENRTESELLDYLPSLGAQHFFRPLFIQSTPTPLCKEGLGSSGFIFKERVMDKWWASSSSQHSRDYYLRFSEYSALQWVFTDQNGDLFLHGIYG